MQTRPPFLASAIFVALADAARSWSGVQNQNLNRASRGLNNQFIDGASRRLNSQGVERASRELPGRQVAANTVKLRLRALRAALSASSSRSKQQGAVLRCSTTVAQLNQASVKHHGASPALPNHSLKLSPNGKSPGPRYSAGVHFLQRGPGALPLVPA